ncbi:MAG TPA: protein kinase [Pyrinomonadaceae bacterium]|nr:protein kinase [Pyrinomonadaceae bacterium]
MIAPNTLLQNRYLVLNQIGQGGMGAVYIATDQRFGSTVALKETFFDDPNLRKAFEREARLLNHLRHAALPRVSDHFTEDEGQFLVMEYIAGDDLSEKLKERGSAFPASEVLNWADQLLDALDYLHTQEPPVIHRDIKPQNLKLTPRNAIVLLDFGLAKGTPMQTKVTATGSVFGYSRHYAPLEQIQGVGTDPRSDIYSLGATVYHLMTGETPPDALSRATAVLNGQPDPLRPASEVHAQVSPSVAEVISRAMALNANERPQTAAAMREALREAARQEHKTGKDTNLQPSSTNVYEDETKLLYAAGLKTAANEKTGKTGAIAAEGATLTDPTSAKSKVSPSATNVEEAESIVTKTAKADATTVKPTQRRRTIAIAASAVILVVLAAVVYTFTRNSNQTPASTDKVQSALPATNNTENQNSATPAETPQKAESAVPTPNATSTTERHMSAPVKHAQIETQPTPATKDESAQTNEAKPPEPPNPDETTLPRRAGRRGFPPPGTPEFDEAIRQAVERRRAAEEQRRATQQQRMMILRQVRRQRRQQTQQP